MRRLVLAALLIGACAAAAAADQAVPLALKLAPGDLLRYEVALTGSGGVHSPEGELTAVGLRGDVSLSARVVEVRPDGAARLEATTPRFNLEISIGADQVRFSREDGRLRWFANGREHSPPAGDALRLPLLDLPLQMTVASDGRVGELSLADAGLMELLGQALPAAAGGSLAGFGQPLFPDRPVGVGETWREVSQLLPFGPAAPIVITSSRTLDSHSREGDFGVARIGGFTEVRFRGAGPLAGGVEVPELRQTITSTEFFDTTRGRLLRGDYDIGLSTRITVLAAGEAKTSSAEARLRVHVQAR